MFLSPYHEQPYSIHPVKLSTNRAMVPWQRLPVGSPVVVKQDEFIHFGTKPKHMTKPKKNEHSSDRESEILKKHISAIKQLMKTTAKTDPTIKPGDLIVQYQSDHDIHFPIMLPGYTNRPLTRALRDVKNEVLRPVRKKPSSKSKRNEEMPARPQLLFRPNIPPPSEADCKLTQEFKNVYQESYRQYSKQLTRNSNPDSAQQS